MYEGADFGEKNKMLNYCHYGQKSRKNAQEVIIFISQA